MKALHKAVAAALTGAALAGLSQQTNALAVTNLGALGNSGLSRTTTNANGVPKYAWDGTNGLGPVPHNNGWAHTSHWYSFTLNARAHVTISLTANGGALNPAFSVWKTGGAFVGANHTSHEYNQISIGGASAFLGGAGGDKVTAFRGYANSGPAFTGGGGPIKKGGTCGAYVSNRYARLLLVDLPPGQYLIALGGSCYTNGTAQACGTGKIGYKLKITRAPAP